jgi:lipopolysaccharide export system protein LptA
VGSGGFPEAEARTTAIIAPRKLACRPSLCPNPYMRSSFRLAPLALFAGLLCAPEALADPLLAVGGDVVNLQADALDVDVSAGTAVLTGNVTLGKGDLHVSCPRIDVKFDTTPHVSWARGSGGVSADVRGVHAEAPEVEVDLTKQVLELRGGVRLTRGQGWLQAEKASIELATAHVTLTQVKGSIPVPPRPK